jgi:hypothetical protein
VGGESGKAEARAKAVAQEVQGCDEIPVWNQAGAFLMLFWQCLS